MREVTKLMINEFKLKKLGYDFMGYKIDKKNSLSFHHLIISHKDSQMMGIGEGYLKWNGAILVQDTSHDYLHLIERIDNDVFYLITNEMIDMNSKGYLDSSNIRKIHALLDYFERKHINDKNSKGKRLIKDIYMQRLKF